MRTVLARALDGLGLHAWIEPGHVRVTRYAPAITAWPGALPLRIVMLSDFHLCEPWLGPATLGGIVAATNGLRPDVVLLLGDYEAGPRFSSPIDRRQWAAVLARLRAPLGVHAVLGNHDHADGSGMPLPPGVEPPAREALLGAGIPVYVNEAVRLAHAGGAFWLAGLADQFAGRRRGRLRAEDRGHDDLPATLAQVTDGAPVVLMAHEPDIFPQVPDRVALTLSGHTHGGQIRFFGHAPVVPSAFGRRFLHGHIVEDGRHLIVGRGLGLSGLPLRVATPPEIVVVDLGSGNTGYRGRTSTESPMSPDDRIDETLKLSRPAHAALRQAGIVTFADLRGWTRDGVARLHGIGPKSFVSLEPAMAARSVAFKS